MVDGLLRRVYGRLAGVDVLLRGDDCVLGGLYLLDQVGQARRRGRGR